MKQATFHRPFFAALIAVGLVGGGWLVWKMRAGADSRAPVSAKPALATVEALTSVLSPVRPSASDSEITRWSAKALHNAQDERAWVGLGDAFMQKARETADAAYYARAEGAYQKALATRPQCIEAMIGLAWVNGGRHEFEKSVEWANKALALDPKSNEAYGLIGDASVEMGNYDDAFEKYQKMLDIRPDISSYSRGAHALQLSGNTRKALWLMDKAVKAGGPYAENTAWCRAQMAQILFSNGAYAPAEQMLTQALKQTPHNYHLLTTMGKVKAARKDYAAAIDSYTKAIAIAPQIDTVVALGDLYTVIGKKDEAEKQYQLVETIQKLNKANGVRGDLQIAQFYADHDRNLPEALRMAEEEVKTRKNVYACDTLAWCYYKNGRLEEAKRWSEQALSRHTPEALFLFHKGMIYAKSGERSTAQKALYEAASLSAEFHPIYAGVAADTVNQLGARPLETSHSAAR